MPSSPRPDPEKAADREVDWDGVRLHVITGKGGTGKTTAAASLAIALATGGHRVLIIEVEGRQGLSQVFDVPPLAYAERRMAVAPGGGEVFGLAVDAEEALLEYLEMFYNLRRAGTALRRMGAIDFATTVAPGVRDVLLTGKAKEAVRRQQDGVPVYDAVVMDAPPTGRIARFLNVNAEVAGLARSGPIRTQADAVMAVIGSRLTAVHVVTLLEEMPVQETADGVQALREAGLPVGGVIVNQIRRPRLNRTNQTKARRHSFDVAAIAAELSSAGVLTASGTLAGSLVDVSGSTIVDVLIAEAADHAERVALEQRERENIQALHRPTYEIAFMPDGVDVGTLYEFAESLREQGMA
ncbi:MAG: AAA family ATPase [Actinobacteria bacterium]|nr:AAA family ATPase [Actinomycetota bacterium]MSW36588.1 AAA family ATPase [Actinomycetota bacterium]